MDQPWDVSARQYLARLGSAEYAAHLRSRRSARERYCPSEYHSSLISALNAGDEESFKAIKMLSGDHSALGH